MYGLFLLPTPQPYKILKPNFYFGQETASEWNKFYICSHPKIIVVCSPLTPKFAPTNSYFDGFITSFNVSEGCFCGHETIFKDS